jgi:hypothetical protein
MVLLAKALKYPNSVVAAIRSSEVANVRNPEVTYLRRRHVHYLAEERRGDRVLKPFGNALANAARVVRKLGWIAGKVSHYTCASIAVL